MTVALVTLVLGIPAPSAAPRRDRAAVEAFLLFLESVAAQRTARTCERGIPGYRQRFDDIYTRWAAKHRSRIARGEAFFREALREKDRPYLDHAKVQQIENAIAELAQSPPDTSPTTLDDSSRAMCEAVVADLEAALAAD